MSDDADRAVVLLSGGLDSTTILAMALDEGFRCHALSFDYGQRHADELDSARAVAAAAGVSDHRVATIDLRLFGGSALTDEIEVPTGRTEDETEGDIPVTYVPARNTIFLSFGVAFAEVVDAQALFIGVNAVDYSGYPDCRPEYVEAFQTMANLATKAAVEGQRLEVRTPLIDLTKAEIVQRGLELGVDYSLTTSCYAPQPRGACGACDACRLRLRGFEEAGVEDPIPYVAESAGWVP